MFIRSTRVALLDRKIFSDGEHDLLQGGKGATGRTLKNTEEIQSSFPAPAVQGPTTA